MAKYELSNDQVKQISSILSNATVKVGDAPVVLSLIKAVNTPIKEEVKK